MKIKSFFRISSYIRFLRRHRWNSRAKRDKFQLEKKFPQLQNFIEKSTMLAKELNPYYEEYTSKVSPSDMAISLEMAIFLHIFCDVTKPKSIADLGSGFSSFVFRHYQAITGVKPDVWTVDDDEEWLEKTRTFLVLHGLSDENLITWDLFLQRGPKSFDLILHDLGSMETRAKTLPTVLTLSHSNGLVILDDVDKSEYFSVLLQVTKHLDCELYNLKFYTLDSIGRHAGLLIIHNTFR